MRQCFYPICCNRFLLFHVTLRYCPLLCVTLLVGLSVNILHFNTPLEVVLFRCSVLISLLLRFLTVCWFQRLDFFLLYDSKQNILVFWSIGRAKQAILLCYTFDSRKHF